MNDRTTSDGGSEGEDVAKQDPSCSCIQEPYASLPPDLQPKPQPKKGGLRQATCPRCGFEFWTNRKTDVCLDCERGGKASG